MPYTTRSSKWAKPAEISRFIAAVENGSDVNAYLGMVSPEQGPLLRTAATKRALAVEVEARRAALAKRDAVAHSILAHILGES